MKKYPQISVLLPTYRQPEILILTLRDLQNQDYPHSHWELIVIDDGSCDVSAMLSLAMFAQTISVTIKRVSKGGKYYHAKLFNELIRLADPGTKIFVHIEDVRCKADFLSNHVKWHLSKEETLVTGPMCEGVEETFDPSACNRWELMKLSGVESEAYRCCFQAIFAKSMSYTRTLIKKIAPKDISAPFDTNMKGWGYHETEFAFRVQKLGFLCVYDTSCGVFHPKHNLRDESNYRMVNRKLLQARGTEDNIKYLCVKHDLAALPNWKVGIPIKSPAKIY